MDTARLRSLLSDFPARAMLVVGDFFLDKYLVVDPMLAERSLETGLDAHQVVRVRCMPGAAGTVTSNLRALGVNVVALGVVGDDGEGFELLRALDAAGAMVDPIVIRPERFTPTYTKPVVRVPEGGVRELNRLDIKNRAPLPESAEDEVIAHLRQLLPQVHGVIIADQVQEEDCGVITERVREELCLLARAYPSVMFAADSRERIGLFEDVILKPNAREAMRAVHGPDAVEGDRAAALAAGETLYRRAGQPVFLTLGEDGVMAFHQDGPTLVPAVRAIGPIDIVGAGDSAMAGIASALVSGATPPEAAQVGCLAAGVTVQQIGTTGVATPKQILDLWQRVG